MNNRSVDQLWTRLDKKAPYAQWQIVQVSFTAANTDTEVQHDLLPPNPEGIDYQALRATVACALYHDGSATRKAWQSNYIYLRSSAIGKVDILLTVSDDGGDRVFPVTG